MGDVRGSGLERDVGKVWVVGVLEMSASFALALAGNEEERGDGEGGAKAEIERIREWPRPGGAGAS
jgi:hypothetical protein